MVEMTTGHLLKRRDVRKSAVSVAAGGRFDGIEHASPVTIRPIRTEFTARSRSPLMGMDARFIDVISPKGGV
ncbi:hypothetical protein GCM10023088_09200 [Actinomadura verrucosospora]